MDSYFTLPITSCAVFGLCAVLLTFGAIFLLVGSAIMHLKRKYLFYCMALTALMLFVFQGITDVCGKANGGINTTTFFGEAIGSLPYAILILILAAIAGAEVFLFFIFVNRSKEMPTKGVIKECLDSLPDGVCFYDTDGQPLLVNRQMQCISEELFDSEILNANFFQSRLLETAEGKSQSIIRTKPTVIVRTADGRAWDFHCRELNIEKKGLYELIAFDISEQYSLSIALKERNERLNRVNERLRRFSDEMVTLTAEKELLKAKIDVHDNIGRALLACRAYFMQNPQEGCREDLLALWRHVFSVMKNEALPSGEWEMLKKTADMLGIKIELSGTLPDDFKIRTAVVTAIRECLTNTANHAGGDRLSVSVTEDDRSVTAEFTNTGKAPEGEIQETGGLKNLRSVVERADGIMTIESTPRFLLRLEFRKGEQCEWLKQEYWS